jgi:excinuclease ABC subunit C
MAHPLAERVARLPRSPGVYLWKDGSGNPIYVGKAVDLRSRVSSYLDPQADKTARMVAEAKDVDFVAVGSEKDALLLEQTLIKRHRPRYNVRLTDDKQYPYLKLTREPYPRLLKVHRREDDGARYFGPFPDGTGAWFVLQAINDLVPLRRCRVLPKEKCLYLDIGKCAGPCVQACTDEEYDLLVAEVDDLLKGKADHLLERVHDALEAAVAEERFEDAGRLRDQLNGLRAVMERQHMVHAAMEDRDVAALEARGDVGQVVLLHQRDGKIVDQSPFVVAGVQHGQEAQALADFLLGYYQDRQVPRYVTASLPATVAEELEADLRTLSGAAVTVEAPQRGDKRRWLEVAETNARLRLEEELHRRAKRGMGALETLQRDLGLPALPRVVEGFDVSHSGGRFTRASMVRFVDGKPDKAGYRTFNMRSVGESAIAAGTAQGKRGAGREVDDFASIAEAVERRYAGILERGEELPDLVLVDGGRGQLEAARASLLRLDLASLPLCSLAKEEELVHVPARLNPLRLPRDNAALQLLQRVRDEAHRFAIKQVRSKASAQAAASPLDEVKGIGPRRRAELVKAFGGLEGLRAASAPDLARLPGITPEIAAEVVRVLRNGSGQETTKPTQTP